MKRRRNGKKGFTLMEVLVGIAVVAIISVPLLNMFATSFKVGRYSYNIDNANAVALTTVEELRSGKINFSLDGGGNYAQTGFFDYGWKQVGTTVSGLVAAENVPPDAYFRVVATVTGESPDSMQSAFLPQLVHGGSSYNITIGYEHDAADERVITLKLAQAGEDGDYTLTCGGALLYKNGSLVGSAIIPKEDLASSVLPVMADHSASSGPVNFEVTGVSGVELGLFVFGDDGENELVSMSVVSGGASITHLAGGMDMLSFDRLDINVKVIREADGLVISDYATKSYVLPYTPPAGGAADEGGEEVP